MPNDNPTFPPAPKRPPPKPVRIPAVVEKYELSKPYQVNPFKGIQKPPEDTPVNPPKRRPTPSELDLDVVRHTEQINGLERRIGSLEAISASTDSKLDSISKLLNTEIHDRKLEKAAKEDEKVKEDQKTKRYQAVLIAIPLILSPILGLASSYLSKDTPKPTSDVVKVVVSPYTEDADECKDSAKSKQEFIDCIRQAQLKNTPVFNK